ncbi:hypothetical protein J1N35_041117 [Gossypium stocksii]|uniref:Uncharacterized protein n=1 Tax=Gossypium stocksii TaxID=47602 RepID=A0A9D3ZJF1_9ROSI|nr:hypothetical protein J1N35_041117 [Gossypium stocksii]
MVVNMESKGIHNKYEEDSLFFTRVSVLEDGMSSCKVVLSSMSNQIEQLLELLQRQVEVHTSMEVLSLSLLIRVGVGVGVIVELNDDNELKLKLSEGVEEPIYIMSIVIEMPTMGVNEFI